MSKALAATCQDGVVTADALEVPGVTILSEGVAPSSGILLLEAGAKTYFAKTTPDLKTTLGKIADALDSIASALTAIDAKPPGTEPPAPAAAGDIAAISSLQAELEELMENLK
jgi:hypothetical protein